MLLDFGDREQFSPRLNANADAVLVEDWFFIDANASADQNEVTPFAAGGGRLIEQHGQYQYVLPLFSEPLYSSSIQGRRRSHCCATPGMTSSTLRMLLATVPESKTCCLPWVTRPNCQLSPGKLRAIIPRSRVQDSFDGAGDNIFDRANNNSELKSAQLNLGYQLNRFWQVNGFYGEEWNDFDTISRNDIDGDYWDVGLRWTPNTRTTVEAGTGDRFFGSTPRFSIKHQHKRSELSASYKKEITFGRDIRTSGRRRGIQVP